MERKSGRRESMYSVAKCSQNEARLTVLMKRVSGRVSEEDLGCGAGKLGQECLSGIWEVAVELFYGICNFSNKDTQIFIKTRPHSQTRLLSGIIGGRGCWGKYCPITDTNWMTRLGGQRSWWKVHTVLYITPSECENQP